MHFYSIIMLDVFAVSFLASFVLFPCPCRLDEAYGCGWGKDLLPSYICCYVVVICIVLPLTAAVVIFCFIAVRDVTLFWS